MLQAPLQSIVEAQYVVSQERPKYANVLQELLYALLGFTGDVFVDELEDTPAAHGFHSPERSSFHMSDAIRWIEPSDRALIDDILTMGFHYHQINRFVKSQQDLASSLDGNMCWRALAIGLEGMRP